MNEWRGLKGRVVKLEDVLTKKLPPVLEPLAPSEWNAIFRRVKEGRRPTPEEQGEIGAYWAAVFERAGLGRRRE